MKTYFVRCFDAAGNLVWMDSASSKLGLVDLIGRLYLRHDQRYEITVQ